MTVRAIGKILAAELHQLLKPLGFSKRGSTFSRSRSGYVELFHIEGSRWNSEEEPWVFYLEVAVRLDGVPTDASAKGLWRVAHAVGRASGLVPSVPGDFSVTSSSVPTTAEELARIIYQASTVLPDSLAEIRPRAAQGLISPRPLPASWAE